MVANIYQRHCASITAFLACLFIGSASQTARAQMDGPQQVMVKVQQGSQRLEMTVNTSRILTLDENIPRAQVNNPDILDLHPLSPTQVQIFARKPGVTQVNLWDQNDQVKSVDVIVYGDARELAMLLRSQFPSSALRVVPLANSVVISGYVERPAQVSNIVRIAEDYYPKVINNITVGGVQQVLLHVKVMEVSRTKLRAMGFDFSWESGGDFVVSSISGLIASAANGGSASGLGGDTVRFGIVDGSNFFGFLEALRQNNLMKILAEPTLVTVSGRPANFRVGGEFPIIVPQSLGTVSIEYKNFGTQVDFVPIVLGNGRIRLEVRPQVSEVDITRGVTINDTTVPGLRVRSVDTGVEMRAGQTLALAGLVQTRVEAENRGLPVLGDLPLVGAAFRRVQEEVNEIELLIMVTPELVDAMEHHEVPPGGPGLSTISPSGCELFIKGHIEVPNPQYPGGAGYHYPATPVETPNGQGGEAVPAGPAAGDQTQRSQPNATWNGAQNYQHNAARLPATRVANSAGADNAEPEFVGTVGYDVQQ